MCVMCASLHFVESCIEALCLGPHTALASCFLGTQVAYSALQNINAECFFFARRVTDCGAHGKLTEINVRIVGIYVSIQHRYNSFGFYKHVKSF